MKLSEQQRKQWAEEFETYRDVIRTPGWRSLVEEPLVREMAWAEEEIKRLAISGEEGFERRLIELRAYRISLDFVLNQILSRIEVGSLASKTLQERAAELGVQK